MLVPIDIPRILILMGVSEINQLICHFGLISLTELYLPYLKCFSTYEGDVSNMSGSSEAPNLRGS